MIDLHDQVGLGQDLGLRPAGLSLIFWSVTILGTIRYVLIVLRADNEGEGGIPSLMTRLTRRGSGISRWRKWLFVATAGISADAIGYVNLPRDRTVIMGSQIEV